MKTNLDVLTEVPCFKCLFWDWKKESHLYCNPNECGVLTEWLFKQAEDYEQGEDSLTVVSSVSVRKSSVKISKNSVVK